MKIFYVLVATIFIQISAHSQSFYDGFSYDSGNWYTTSDNISKTYKEDYLFMKIKVKGDNGNNGILNTRNFDLRNDYIIESTQTLLKGTTGNGILFNYKDKNNFMKFLITDRDEGYSVWEVKNGKSTALVSWSKNSAINKGFKRNTLKIKKTGNMYRFYANGTQIANKNINYVGSKAGIFLGAYLGAELKVESFRYTPDGGYIAPSRNDNSSKPSVVADEKSYKT